MIEWLRQLAYALSCRFKSRARLEAENLVLRQQLNVLVRKLPKRLRLANSDRLLLFWTYRLFPSLLSAIWIVRPETVIRWLLSARIRGIALGPRRLDFLSSVDASVRILLFWLEERFF